ncbi:hypothetical protein KP509_29G024200 [Ceratopteris richardii]|nr:hypothetical protein KP509_29G024200 [Ceratopteris richardii]
MLAAAGEDDGIKLISTIDSSIIRVFKGHNAPVVSLAFDPNNEFLGSSGSDGTIMCWSLSSGKRVHTIYHAAPNTDLNNMCRNGIAWHPKGDVLAVPGRKNGVDVVMYDRDTGEKVFSLKGGHSATVGVLMWSPNGKYLATAAGDNQVILWDADNRQDIDSQKFEAQICSLAWKHKGNALAVIDAYGKFGVWEPVVPSHMVLPNDDLMQPSAIDREELLHFTDDEERDGSEDDTNLSGPDRELDGSPVAARRVHKHKDAVEHVTLKKSSILEKNGLQPQNKHMHDLDGVFTTVPTMQSAFQPCSTKPNSGTRYFLTYNLIGCITSCQNEGLSHVEVEFHDTGRGVRVPAMTDYFGFSMAAMNESGSVFASPKKGEKSPSTILYRPFSSWASNSEWSMRFPAEEEVRAVALGSGWVAAATTSNYLRIFSEGGLQVAVLSLEGPIVTMVGHQELLAVATHAALPFTCGQQIIKFMVLNLNERVITMEGCLPLSPGSYLTWLGFSEAGKLSFYDSKGILRLQNKQYGGCWIPIFCSSKEVKGEDESIWMVGLNDMQIMCVICKYPNKEPQVSPKPILSIFKPVFPLAHSDLGAEDLENEFIIKSLHLAQMTDETAHPIDDEDQEEEILKLEADLDRCILRLIAAACKGDKLVKVVELTKKLTLDKSWKGAIKLVSAMKLPALAERLSSMYEERMNRESYQDQEPFVSHTLQNSQVLNPVPHSDLNPVYHQPASVAAVPKPASMVVREIDCNTQKAENSESKANVSLSKQKVASMEEKSAKAVSKNAITDMSTEQNSMKPKEDVNPSNTVQAEAVQRANNPFAKSVSNPFAKPPATADSQSAMSLLDSLKRMKNSENESKGRGRPNKSAKHS